MRELKIYNSATRKKEIFTPIEEGKIKMYVCGPTVYNLIHVGNARCFVIFDFFRRFFEYIGYDVTYIQNFTDVDDKMIKRANEENLTLGEVAEKYISEYKKDAEGLGIREATVHPRATGHIAEIIDIITVLIEKGHAYAVEIYDGNSDVYFSTKSFSGYGKLSNTNTDDLESGARVEISEIKRDSLDFVLWKAYKPGEPYWDSPWGKGRPGWHTECSAMAKKYLGSTVDFHCGGVDLMFPHHENEIAQSESAWGVPFAGYWLHNGFINIDNKKMSKSEGISFMARDVAEEYGYQAIRYFILSSHYRSPVNYSKETIEGAVSALERIYTCGENVKFLLEKSADAEKDVGEFISSLDGYREKIIAALCDDFNTADAVGIFFELIRDINIFVAEKNPSKVELQKIYDFYNELCGLFGFKREKKEAGELSESEILDYIEQRIQAKKDKNYKKADDIRNMLKEKGVILEDTPQGTKWKNI